MGFFIGKVTHGRPDCTGRDEREIAVYDMLDSLGVEYEHIDHEEASTNALCEDIEKVLGVHICKNLFLCDRKKTRFFMLSMRGDKQFVTREFSRSIGAPRLSFAKEEIQARVEEAGLEIVDARITYLAYAPEIAAAMLQRQQAAAVVDARKQETSCSRLATHSCLM